ncbi:hypothetical protein GZH47_32065 (plasmid) [Paenibacillus rhizovicinus]|uniref:Glycosyl hydrolase family 4 C-terminal domain-containing protein n=1 Tax=Paenibacillus rhizovicinus TaxID=2704463 RepID=A0A6C0PAC4_9BACL|nr:hypothetical protein [Paenibacillus rhizovicinus]QHW35524.1 hypothetical protein GZH47_32065 [Paenibacillus rhizovicinus]
MVSPKISIIGAGSGAFSLGLIRDLCLTPNLEGSTVHFMDIDSDRLEGVFALCKRYAEERGMNLHLKKTLDRREALQGADFVINTALTASHARLQEGWEIARKHGYHFGGSYHVMYDEAFWINYYQLKFFESLTEDILEICPNAWHLMVANPVITGVTHLLRKYPTAKVVGLCHGYAGIYEVAETLGLDRKSITYQIPGVNHHVWLTDFYYKGENAFPLLDSWIEREAEAYWASGKGGALSRKRVDLYRRYGVLPIGDTASWSGASWPWWYHSGDEVEAKWQEQPIDGWNDYFTWVHDSMEKIKRVSADQSVKVTEAFPPSATDELMIPLIESIACDIPRVFITNILNTGEFVPGIPKDFQVEIPTLASKRGIQGIRTGGLPKQVIAQILRDRVAPVEMELEAFNRGSRADLRELILMDKWTTSVQQADALMDDIFALPYHRDMVNHYR